MTDSTCTTDNPIPNKSLRQAEPIIILQHILRGNPPGIAVTLLLHFSPSAATSPKATWNPLLHQHLRRTPCLNSRVHVSSARAHFSATLGNLAKGQTHQLCAAVKSSAVQSLQTRPFAHFVDTDRIASCIHRDLLLRRLCLPGSMVLACLLQLGLGIPPVLRRRRNLTGISQILA